MAKLIESQSNSAIPHTEQRDMLSQSDRLIGNANKGIQLVVLAMNGRDKNWIPTTDRSLLDAQCLKGFRIVDQAYWGSLNVYNIDLGEGELRRIEGVMTRALPIVTGILESIGTEESLDAACKYNQQYSMGA